MAEPLVPLPQASTVVVRGGGDLATGVVQKLWRAGFRVVVLEVAQPTTIRRTVAVSSAVVQGTATVEDVTAQLVTSPQQCAGVWQKGQVPVLVDPAMQTIEALAPVILVDAILAKRNIGMHSGIAPITIALGPGFTAPRDADAVVETMRGHSLGRLVFNGSALPNTGVPGLLGGKTAERVVHAPVKGTVKHLCELGSRVAAGEILFYIDETPVPSPLTGTLRGLIADGMRVPKGLKCADVDPRSEAEVDIYTISDKARCLGGAVLEACLYLARKKEISLRLFG